MKELVPTVGPIDPDQSEQADRDTIINSLKAATEEDEKEAEVPMVEIPDSDSSPEIIGTVTTIRDPEETMEVDRD